MFFFFFRLDQFDPQQMADKLRQRRLERKLTMQDVAKRAGVATGTVHSLEHGSLRIQLDKFLKISEVLQLPPSELLQVNVGESRLAASEFEDELAKRAAKDLDGLLRLVMSVKNNLEPPKRQKKPAKPLPGRQSKKASSR